MTHYVCTSCGGQSDQPKVCETPGCERQGQDLQACDCTDNKHGADTTTPAA